MFCFSTKKCYKPICPYWLSLIKVSLIKHIVCRCLDTAPAAAASARGYFKPLHQYDLQKRLSAQAPPRE